MGVTLGGTSRMFPGSGLGGGSAYLIAFGLSAFTLLLWEIFYHQNARRWPIWSLMLPAMTCPYLAARQDADDQSWWWIAFFVSMGVGFTIYLVFWADETSRGRR